MNDLTHDERNAARVFGLRENFQPLINVFLPSYKFSEGQIISITGDSGSGKTLFLDMIEKSTNESVCNLNKIKFNKQLSAFQIIFNKLKSVDKTLRLLGKIGLGEAGLILRPVQTYSTGEQFRFRIALAIARQYKVLLIDEFGMQLDEILTKNIAFSLRNIADNNKITVFAASCNDFYLRDLQPDISFKLDETGMRLCKKYRRVNKISYHRRLKILRADNKAWKKFAHWHYKSHQTGPTSDIFTINLDGKPVGVIVYGYPALFSSLRSSVTNDRYKFTQPNFAKLLNKETRIIRRIVMSPKFRGVGLAAELVRQTINLLSPDVVFVESLASMGKYCSFFVNAGFQYVKSTKTLRIVQRFNSILTENKFDDKVTESEKFLTWLKTLPEYNQQNIRKYLYQLIRMRLRVKNSTFKDKELSETQNTQKFHEMIEEALAVRFTSPSYFIKHLRGNHEKEI